MVIEFMRDFQSAHTGERFYPRGSKVDLAEAHARALIAEGVAVFVPIDARRGQVTPAKGEPSARKGALRG